MTDNGPAPEYLFIYPWTVKAAVLTDTLYSSELASFTSSPAEEDLTTSALVYIYIYIFFCYD